MQNKFKDFNNKEPAQVMKYQKYMKKIALKQLAGIIQKYGKNQRKKIVQSIKWGQEIQGHLLESDEKGILQLSKAGYKSLSGLPFPIDQQMGTWVFETTPPQPYDTTCNFYDVIQPLRDKYSLILAQKYTFVSIPYVPVVGISDTLVSFQPGPQNKICKSAYVTDDLFAQRQRYTLAADFLQYRYNYPGPIAYIQLYKDLNTTFEEQSKTEPKAGFIQIDSIIQAWGSCNLQTTFSASSLDHARYMYDQLHNLIPFCLALTAGTPFLKGKIQNKDTIWELVCILSDDRTPSQRDPKSADHIPILRNTFVPFYMNNGPSFKPQYNDIETGVRPGHIEFVKSIFKEKGVEVDDQFIYFIAYTSMRDITLLMDAKQQDKNLIQLMIKYAWTSVRFRTPIDDQNLWRLEFRPMEMLLTADQNSAFMLLSYLMARLLTDDLSTNFLIPISKTMENYERAQTIDAAFKQKFFFRTNIHDNGPPVIDELTANEILFGKGNFGGLFAEFERVMSGCIKNCPHTAEVIECLKTFLSGRATGKLKTLARWQRDFVDRHPGYTHNSILSRQVMNDMLLQLHRISTGQVKDQHFASIFPDVEVSLGNGPNHPNKKCGL